MRVKRSAGEHLLFHPAGGAIALLSATRLVYSATNFEINDLYWKPQEMNPQPGYGVYLYRITLVGQDGKQVSKSGRVVWNK